MRAAELRLAAAGRSFASIDGEFFLRSRTTFNPMKSYVFVARCRAAAYGLAIVLACPQVLADKGSQAAFAEGDRLLRDGNAKEAVARFESGLKTDPNNATALFLLGRAYLRAGQPRLAVTRIESGL